MYEVFIGEFLQLAPVVPDLDLRLDSGEVP